MQGGRTRLADVLLQQGLARASVLRGTERRDSGHMTNVTPEPQEEVTSEDGKGAFASSSSAECRSSDRGQRRKP